MKSTLLKWVWALAAVVPLSVPAAVLPGELSHAGTALEKVGEVDYRFLWKRITTAGLYVDENRPRPAPGILAVDYPKAVLIEYGVGVSAERFRDMTRDSLAEAWPASELAEHAAAIDRLCNWFRDVEKGDRYALYWIPDNGLTLILNGEALGRIEDARAAQIILSLWLGRAAVSDEQRDRLLAKWRG